MKRTSLRCLIALLPVLAHSACIGHRPPAAPVSRGPGEARNSGARRSSDVSGLPIPPGPGGLPQPGGKPGHGTAVGDLVILPWAGFRAALTYTFDDSNRSQIEHYPELQALGVPMTFYLTTGKPESGSPVWAQALEDGHELGNHSKTHAQVGRPADIEAASQFIRQTFGVPVWTMASPFGDPSYPPLAGPRFLVNRGVVNGLIGATDAVDPYDLFCFVPRERAPASDFNAEVDAARRAGKWRIVLVHGFVGGSDGAYQPILMQDFAAAVGYAKSRGDVWIDSMVDVAAYWRGQRAVASASTSVAGRRTTWTWTLPAHFPPGKYLRVTVPGGMLWQQGKALDWNPHGYYEVSLDAGGLTLSAEPERPMAP